MKLQGEELLKVVDGNSKLRSHGFTVQVLHYTLNNRAAEDNPVKTLAYELGKLVKAGYFTKPNFTSYQRTEKVWEAPPVKVREARMATTSLRQDQAEMADAINALNIKVTQVVDAITALNVKVTRIDGEVLIKLNTLQETSTEVVKYLGSVTQLLTDMTTVADKEEPGHE